MGMDKQNGLFLIWDSDTFEYKTELSSTDIIQELFKNDNSFANAHLVVDRNSCYFRYDDLTNSDIYGKLYEKTITCGNIKITLFNGAYMVLETSSAIYVSPLKVISNDTFYLPVQYNGTLRVLRGGFAPKYFCKVNFTMRQLRRWYLLQGFEQVYKVYQESIENNNNTHIIFSIYE